MRDAETVTFGGSALDRAAGSRGDAARQAALWASGRVLPLWRGKVLIQHGQGLGQGLGWVGSDHPVLAGAEPPVFLGLDAGAGCFAADISSWVPPDLPTSAPPLFFDPSEQQHPDLPEGVVFCELRGVMVRLSAREAEFAATARALLQWHRTHRFCAACGQPTAPVDAGWQRRCDACTAQHFPRTDPVVIMLITHGNAALIGRSPGWPEGMYSCLAGFMEPGETIEAAVRREVAEEAGVEVGPVRYLASQPWPFPASLMIGCQGEALGSAVTLDPKELEDALWIGREEMMTVMSGTHPRIKPARKGAIAHFLIQNWLADRLD